MSAVAHYENRRLSPPLPPLSTHPAFHWPRLLRQLNSQVASEFLAAESFGMDYGSASSFVSYLYSYYLGRAPDSAGFDWWTTQLTNGTVAEADVESGFAGSSEAATYTASLESTIENIFQAELGRSADAGGLAFFVETLRNGVSVWTVQDNIHNSQEAIDYRASLAEAEQEAAYQVAVQEARGQVSTFYWTLFGRAPDANSELWVSNLASGSWTTDSVKNYLANTAEGQAYALFCQQHYLLYDDVETTNGPQTWVTLVSRQTGEEQALGYLGQFNMLPYYYVILEPKPIEIPDDLDGYDSDGYDPDGFDRSGYDRDGYDRNGFSASGYDRQGYDVFGYNSDGYDRNGYDQDGYNEYGLDSTGLERPNPSTSPRAIAWNSISPIQSGSVQAAPISVDLSVFGEDFNTLMDLSYFVNGKSMEWSSTVVKDSSGMLSLVNNKPGTTGTASPDLNVGFSQTVVGTFHTHPYDATEYNYTGVSFSGADFEYLINMNHQFAVTQSGSDQFLIARTSATPVSITPGTIKTEFNALQAQYLQNGDSFPRSVERAAKDTATKYGIAYYGGQNGIFTKSP